MIKATLTSIKAKRLYVAVCLAPQKQKSLHLLFMYISL